MEQELRISMKDMQGPMTMGSELMDKINQTMQQIDDALKNDEKRQKLITNKIDKL